MHIITANIAEQKTDAVPTDNKVVPQAIIQKAKGNPHAPYNHTVLARGFELEKVYRERQLTELKLQADAIKTLGILSNGVDSGKSDLWLNKTRKSLIATLTASKAAYQDLAQQLQPLKPGVEVPWCLKTQKMHAAETPGVGVFDGAIELLQQHGDTLLRELSAGRVPELIAAKLRAPRMLGQQDSIVTYYSMISWALLAACVPSRLQDLLLHVSTTHNAYACPLIDVSATAHAVKLPPGIKFTGQTFRYHHANADYVPFIHSGFAFGGAGTQAHKPYTLANPYGLYDASSFVSMASGTKRLSTIGQYAFYCNVLQQQSVPAKYRADIEHMQQHLTPIPVKSLQPGDVVIIRTQPPGEPAGKYPLGKSGSAWIYAGTNAKGQLLALGANRFMPNLEGIGVHCLPKDYLQRKPHKVAVLRVSKPLSPLFDKSYTTLNFRDLDQSVKISNSQIVSQRIGTKATLGSSSSVTPSPRMR